MISWKEIEAEQNRRLKPHSDKLKLRSAEEFKLLLEFLKEYLPEAIEDPMLLVTRDWPTDLYHIFFTIPHSKFLTPTEKFRQTFSRVRSILRQAGKIKRGLNTFILATEKQRERMIILSSEINKSRDSQEKFTENYNSFGERIQNLRLALKSLNTDSKSKSEFFGILLEIVQLADGLLDKFNDNENRRAVLVKHNYITCSKERTDTTELDKELDEIEKEIKKHEDEFKEMIVLKDLLEEKIIQLEQKLKIFVN